MNFLEYAKYTSAAGVCAKHIEQALWGNEPTCPYCNSKESSRTKANDSFLKQHYCKDCESAYSAQDIINFHKDLSLHQWCLMLWFGFYTLQVLSDLDFLANAIGISEEVAQGAVKIIIDIIRDQQQFTTRFFGCIPSKTWDSKMTHRGGK